MRAVFHIGLPKTGTTTLQNSLHGASDALARHGILYPSLLPFGHRNHHPLVLSVLPPEKLPRQFRFRSRAQRDRLAAGAVESVAQQIAKAGARDLLLSSEYFSREFTEPELARLRDLPMRPRIWAGSSGSTGFAFPTFRRERCQSGPRRCNSPT
jgi:hypothetical protein